MFNDRFVVMFAIAGLAFASGCSQKPTEKRTEIHYPGMLFTSPNATGKFQSLSVLDTVAHVRLKRVDLPILFIRLDGKTVLLLSELNRGEATNISRKGMHSLEKSRIPACIFGSTRE